MHRMSGVSNFVGLLCVSWWLVLAILSPDNPVSANILSFFSGRLGMMILFAWSFGLFFHFCAGVRHLAWDLGIGFELKTMHKSGYFAVFMAVVLTVVTWIIVLVL
jgi:succinate dehydrogenase / fumarate reductase cytochrome b subunit